MYRILKEYKKEKNIVKIAKKLGISKQLCSYYLKKSKKFGLVFDDLTPKGNQFIKKIGVILE